MIIKNNNIKINNLNNNNEQQRINKQPVQGQSFDSILSDKLRQQDDVKFSKHAELRLKDRNIELSGQQKERLNSAINKAEAKGIKDSLVLLDNMAFVVSVKNRTVVTALNGNELKENVFTNIDGAVIN